MTDDNSGANDSGASNNDGNGSTDGGSGDAGKSFSQADLDRIVADRVARERSKYSDYADLKKFKQGAMSEHEKALQEAKDSGRAEALATAGVRLARAEFKAAAADRVPKEQLDGFLEYADLSKFIGTDGEPDDKAIKAAVERLAPKGGRTNFDGGPRTSATGGADMNALLRRQAGVG